MTQPMTPQRELEEQAKGHICGLCRTEPRVAYLNGEFRLRCRPLDILTH